jgi:hypothetical protein
MQNNAQNLQKLSKVDRTTDLTKSRKTPQEMEKVWDMAHALETVHCVFGLFFQPQKALNHCRLAPTQHHKSSWLFFLSGCVGEGTF